ncbi:sugar-transfer associated ATP-grasp domain-containing protein [Aquibium microcysteis]|uniref:sugar-transfer associated ATP-grasp domain-containing protein n=1 Tax=Aquibium microcysteis TaxID=675281 RepID=UPI00165CF9DA|nr:sugar-transfer associated ATP-grasp domain-containing protein [Aquibium microcysteis]
MSDLVAEEFRRTVPGPLWRLRALASGHPSRSIALLPPEVRASGAYLRQTRFYRRRAYYNRMLYAALHNKISQKLWLDRVCPEAAPPMTHYVAGERLVQIGGPDRPQRTRAEIPSLLQPGRPLFVKPADAGQGVGAFHLAQDGDGVMINGVRVDHEGFRAWLAEQPIAFTVSGVIEQSAWTRRIFPGAVSTVRIMTATSFVDRRAVVLGAVLKCATSRTAPTDNFQSGRGGTTSSIDLTTGTVGPCVGFDEDRFERTLSDRHPESGAPVAGETLPHWGLLRDTVAGLAAILPCAGIAGWDVAIRDDGITVVEINTLPGIDVLQSAVPLLDTEAKRAILTEMRMF